MSALCPDTRREVARGMHSSRVPNGVGSYRLLYTDDVDRSHGHVGLHSVGSLCAPKSPHVDTLSDDFLCILNGSGIFGGWEHWPFASGVAVQHRLRRAADRSSLYI